jgi:5' nucleotidase, deoxy (Pyrimidine), cytosolic type C protein (NT5C)
MRYNVGVDVDGVLSNFTLAARTLCKMLFNGKPSDDLVQTGWGFDSLGLTASEERLMWDTIDQCHNWWMDHQPLAGTNLLKLLCQNHRVTFVTNRKDGVGWPIEEQTQQFLRQNFQIYSPNVVISGDKGAVAKGLNLHYIIDDRDKNILDVVRDFPQCKSYLKRDTYNKHMASYPLQVDTFDEFAKEIL